MRLLFVAALITVMAPSAPQAVAPQTDNFSIVVDYSPTGWSARCETGCEWTASFGCVTTCNARVDARGIVTLANDRAPEKFSFILERTTDGVGATSQFGTAWTSLSWGCANKPCRARVSNTGVALVAR